MKRFPTPGLRAALRGFYSRQWKMFLFSTASRPALGPTQPPIQWYRGLFPRGLKRQGLEADHSPPSSAEVKKGGAIPPLPHMSSWHRDKFTFLLHNHYMGVFEDETAVWMVIRESLGTDIYLIDPSFDTIEYSLSNWTLLWAKTKYISSPTPNAKNRKRINYVKRF
jgi:hypothetical protein